MSASVPHGAAVGQSFRFSGALRSYDQVSPTTSPLNSVLVAPTSSNQPALTPRMMRALSPRRNVPASPTMTTRETQYLQAQSSPRVVTRGGAVRHASAPTSYVQPVSSVSWTARQPSQPPLTTQVRSPSPEPAIVYDGTRVHSPNARYTEVHEVHRGNCVETIYHEQSPSYDPCGLVSEMDIVAPTYMQPGASCSLEELNIAIQGVMQTIEEERAVRSNETSDLRREIYQTIHQERGQRTKELSDLKSDITTQNENFMQEIVRRSVYEARLQNQVEQITKDPSEIAERFVSIESKFDELKASTEEVLRKTEDFKPQLGPEVLSDPRLVELLVASAESGLKMLQDQLHELVAQKIEAHLGKIDNANSLFGMVREALSTSRNLKDEVRQLKQVLGPTPSMPVLEQLEAREAAPMVETGGQRVDHVNSDDVAVSLASAQLRMPVVDGLGQQAVTA